MKAILVSVEVEQCSNGWLVSALPPNDTMSNKMVCKSPSEVRDSLSDLFNKAFDSYEKAISKTSEEGDNNG